MSNDNFKESAGGVETREPEFPQRMQYPEIPEHGQEIHTVSSSDESLPTEPAEPGKANKKATSSDQKRGCRDCLEGYWLCCVASVHFGCVELCSGWFPFCCEVDSLMAPAPKQSTCFGRPCNPDVC